MNDAKEYTVKRVDQDTFELWHNEKYLATLTKKQAWPVMIGQVHPEVIVGKLTDQAATGKMDGEK